MEWIVYGFMGGLGLVVAAIIGAGVYQAFWGKGKDQANMGPNLSGSQSDLTHHHDISHM